jgi:hypothetical protein
MDNTPLTDPPASSASSDAAPAAPSSSAGHAWRWARRAASLVLLVVAVGALLNLTSVLHMAGIFQRHATVRTPAPKDATATARVVTHVVVPYPYSAAAPGPGCDKGTAVWTLMNATPAQNVVCTATFTRVVATPLGAFVGTSLSAASLPAQYAIRLSVTGIMPCTAAIVHVTTATQSAFDLRLNGPSEVTCSGTGYYLTTTYPSGAGKGSGGSYPVQTTIHAIANQVDGTHVQLSLDGANIGSFIDTAPPVWSVVQLGVSQLGGIGPASADFSNFAIS